MQQEVRGFSVKKMIIERSVSSSNNDKCEVNVNFNKNHLLHDVLSLEHRVNNLSIKKRNLHASR